MCSAYLINVSIIKFHVNHKFTFPHLGKPYGSLYESTHLGSGGGNGGGAGGQGGGQLVLDNGQMLILDGYLLAKGNRGRGSNAGGGSGGSLFVKTLNLRGFGLADVSGGHGSDTGAGGGGAGGRMAVHIAFANKFSGRFRSVGGTGSGQLPGGAAGTVYVEESDRGPQYDDIKYDRKHNRTYVTAQHRRLEIDNEDIDAELYTDHTELWLYTTLSEGDKTLYVFDETFLTRHGNMLIDYPDGSFQVVVMIHKFLGDRTGLVRLRQNQTLFVEYEQSVMNETRAPCSFRIDADSEIYLPETVDMIGTRTVLAGRITGVENLYITYGADIVFLSTAQTALVENGSYVMLTTPGNFSFSTIYVERGSKAEFSQITTLLSIDCALLRVKYQGQLVMNDAQIFSTNAIVESEGVFHLDGRGGPAESGDGHGMTLGSGLGTGGGHGGWGGAPGYVMGGMPYDSVYGPMQTGSGGGLYDSLSCPVYYVE